MAKMSVVFQINTDVENIDSVIKKLKEKYQAKDIKLVEIGFGIKAIQALFILDEEQSTDELEYELQELEGVSSIQIISMNRLG